MCIFEGCKKRAYFNYIGEKKRLYCRYHRKEGMIYLNYNSCIHPCCTKQPKFNKSGETKGLYCASHKQPMMIDIKNSRCIHNGCTKRPNFNIEGQTKGLYCASHKENMMVDVNNPRCKTHLCSTRATGKYDGYCLHCFMHVFPDKPVCRNYKTKEYSVVEYVKAKHPHPWIADKITGGCSRRRPDLLLDMGSHIIIVEVDENKHTDYDCSCENKRLMELSQDLQHRPIVFIRFNPDDYTNQDGILVKSCWKLNKLGVMQITKTKQKEWEERIETLKQQIQYWIDHPTEKTIEIIELFY
jgi:hypothetical protein